MMSDAAPSSEGRGCDVRGEKVKEGRESRMIEDDKDAESAECGATPRGWTVCALRVHMLDSDMPEVTG